MSNLQYHRHSNPIRLPQQAQRTSMSDCDSYRESISYDGRSEAGISWDQNYYNPEQINEAALLDEGQ
jgi:hypothetical protein